MSSHPSDQMSQRSQVSGVTLYCCEDSDCWVGRTTLYKLEMITHTKSASAFAKYGLFHYLITNVGVFINRLDSFAFNKGWVPAWHRFDPVEQFLQQQPLG